LFKSGTEQPHLALKVLALLYNRPIDQSQSIIFLKFDCDWPIFYAHYTYCRLGYRNIYVFTFKKDVVLIHLCYPHSNTFMMFFFLLLQYYTITLAITLETELFYDIYTLRLIGGLESFCFLGLN